MTRDLQCLYNQRNRLKGKSAAKGKSVPWLVYWTSLSSLLWDWRSACLFLTTDSLTTYWSMEKEMVYERQFRDLFGT